VSVSEAGIRVPHDRLELGELLEEARTLVVHFLSVGGNCRKTATVKKNTD
jgi:hypothetical protein